LVWLLLKIAINSFEYSKSVVKRSEGFNILAIQTSIMDFSNPFFLLSLISGLVCILAGWMMIKFPPKWPNYLYGYRTARAMKNEENWVFAQKFSAKEMMKLGVVFLLIAVASPLIPTNSTLIMVVVLVILIGMCLYPIITTERALKKFEENRKLK